MSKSRTCSGSATFYDDNGIRTGKVKGGVETVYYIDGSRIISEKTQGNVLVYIYDSSSQPIGMQYRGAGYANDTWDIFWFEKNLQGDIVAVYNHSGTKLVYYTYDAFGSKKKQLSVVFLQRNRPKQEAGEGSQRPTISDYATVEDISPYPTTTAQPQAR